MTEKPGPVAKPSARPDLAARIEAELSASDRRIRELMEKEERRFEELEKRRDRFRGVAKDLLEKCGSPLQTLGSYFEHAKITRSADHEGFETVVLLPHTPRFPATAEFKIDVTHDAEIRKVLVLHTVHILPVFIEYENADTLAFDLEAIDFEGVRSWLDEKVLSFVRSYLQIQFADEYQRDNLVTDPVASARFSKIFARATLEHNGHTYYFISEDTKKRFEADPEKYVHA